MFPTCIFSFSNYLQHRPLYVAVRHDVWYGSAISNKSCLWHCFVVVDMQEQLMTWIHDAIDGLDGSERRPASYTRIAQALCERCRAHYKGRIWQCVVSTAGQVGFNIACSRDTMYKQVVDSIEVTLFYPKL